MLPLTFGLSVCSAGSGAAARWFGGGLLSLTSPGQPGGEPGEVTL